MMIAFACNKSTCCCSSSYQCLTFVSLLLAFSLQRPAFGNTTSTCAEIPKNPAKTPDDPADRILTDLKTLLRKQETHLQKLESLVQIVEQTVNKLEESMTPPPAGEIDGRSAIGSKEELLQETTEKLPQFAAENEPQEDLPKLRGRREGGYGQAKGVTVAKYKPAWTERFQFLSAVKVDTNVTCLNVLPHEDDEGVSKYVAVGDEQGRLYVFLSQGDVLVDFLTLSPAPVTAMLSYMSVEKNETVLVTGHADGSVLLHRVWEITQAAGAVHVTGGEDWHVLAMEHVRSLSAAAGASNSEVEGVTVTNLELHQVGRMRYILGVNGQGRINVFRENGTLYGVAESGSRPLSFLKQRLLFLTETGAGSLDLRSMTVRKGECDGLNGSRAVTYVFDALERSKAYGFTSEGDLIHVLLLGDVLNFECRVRTRRKSEIDGPLVVQAVKGYLLVGTPENVYVYNITSQQPYVRVGGPRPLFYASLDDIVSAFADGAPVLGDDRSREPLIACNKDRLVVLGLGDGYVGMYKSNLPVYKAEFNAMRWSSPVLVFVVFLIGAWHFLGKKREPFAIWGSDDPFNSITATSSTTVGDRDRGYENSTRPEVRELRGTSRRYVSPSRYPPAPQPGYGGAYRANAVDQNYRTTSDPNFRAPTPEPSGYPKRRDPRFSSSQIVEEKIH